jgi:hypothetical protein
MDQTNRILRLCYELNMHNHLAKTKKFGAEILYSHAANTAMIANRIFDFISDYYQLDTEDRIRLLVAAVLHDVGKMNIEIGKEKHKLNIDTFSNFISRDLSNLEILDDIIHTVNKRDLERLFWISQTHHKSTSLKESFLEITEKDLLLRDILIISDRISSMKSVDSYIKFNDLPLWNSVTPKFFYHEVARIRGVITLKLHLAAEGILSGDGRYPIAYFPEGTLYIASKYPENPRESIRGEIKKVIVDDVYRESVIKGTFMKLTNPRQKRNIFGMAEVVHSSQGWRVIRAAEEFIIDNYNLKDKEDYELAKIWLTKLIKKILPNGKKNIELFCSSFAGQSVEEVVEELFSKEDIPSIALAGAIEALAAVFHNFGNNSKEEDIIEKSALQLMNDLILSFEIPKQRPPPIRSAKGKCSFCPNRGSLRAVKGVFGKGSKKFSHFQTSPRLENAMACPVCYTEFLYRQFVLNLPQDTRLIYAYPQKLYTREFYENTDTVLNELMTWITESDESVELEELEELTERLSFKYPIRRGKGPLYRLRGKKLSSLPSPNYIIVFVREGVVERLFSRRDKKSDIEKDLGFLFICALLARITFCRVSLSEKAEGIVSVPPYVIELSEKSGEAFTDVEDIIASLVILDQIRYLCDYNTIIGPIKTLHIHPRVAFGRFLARFGRRKGSSLYNSYRLLKLIEDIKSIGVLPTMRKVSVMSDGYQELDDLGEFLSQKFYDLRVIRGGTSRYVYTKPMTLLRKHVLKSGGSGIHAFAGELTRMAMEKRVKHEVIANTTGQIKTKLESLVEEMGEDKFKNFIELLNKSFLYYGIKKVIEKKKEES